MIKFAKPSVDKSALGKIKNIFKSGIFVHGYNTLNFERKLSNSELTEIVQKNFDLRPGAIIEQFNLRNLPKENGGRFYRNTAAYGHFGRDDLNLPWEEVSEKVCY